MPLRRNSPTMGQHVGDRGLRGPLRTLRGGETGYLREADIRPLTDPPQLEDLPMDSGAVDALAQTAVVRLNGGLGTSMGWLAPSA